MTDVEFGLLRDLIARQTGIELHDSKRTLLANRLRGRLRARSMATYLDYYNHLRSSGPLAAAELADAITTRTTEFFRYRPHFEHLASEVLPDLSRRLAQGLRGRIWSAGCSTGEEACSAAMTVLDRLSPTSAARVGIEGTDLSPQAIAAAERGHYPRSRTGALTAQQRRQFFADEADGSVVTRPGLRSLLRFRIENLRDAGLAPEGSFDVIFCRYVLIYFGAEFRAQRVRDFARALRDGGTLYLGPSEMLLEPVPGLEHVGPSIYRKVASP